MHQIKSFGDKLSSAVKGRGNKAKDTNFQDVQKKFDEQTANLKALSNDIVGFISGADGKFMFNSWDYYMLL